MNWLKNSFYLIVISLVFLLAACAGETTSNTNEAAAEENNETTASEKENTSNYPTKPVTLMIPFGAGGSTDLFARHFASIAEEHLGKRIIVKNETGGGGLTMYQSLYRANPDGYEMALGLGTTLYAVNPHLNMIDYDKDDFTLIRPTFGYQYMIAASKDAPFKTFEELVQYSKDNKVNVASASIVNSLFIELIKQAENDELQWDIVNYNGAGEATAALMGGHVDISVDPPITYLGPAESGEINLLATLNDNRVDILKDVPTLRELGYDDLVLNAVIGVGGPLDLPDDVVKKWDEVIVKTLEDPRIAEFINQNGFISIDMSQDELMDYFENMSEDFGNVIDRVVQ
ncbi:tripartite tricarboxylate transporter substrate binding protein [Alkalihalobacillus deserti]|uniref:tripartite tricarboxylate transporter substrate binding protein n=1 Tax=Alkalihalobacillus deserti TaxID=2879466 RepID=UPI001D15B2A4|nr:tripartite tricarboxylate transporter substrate binding protein [Alkalihalobacillus deserti]